MNKKLKSGILLFIILSVLNSYNIAGAKEYKGTVDSKSGLFIRKTNSMTSDKISSLADKTEVVIVSATKNWYKIKYYDSNKQEYGFVLRKYIKTNETIEVSKSKKKKKTKETDKKTKNKKEKTAKNQTDKTKNKKETSTEKNKKDKKEKKKAESFNKDDGLKKDYRSVIVAADLLNVREKNSKNSEVIATVRALETYPIVSMTKNWVKIALTGESHGYVMREYVDFSVVESSEGHEVSKEKKNNTENNNTESEQTVLLTADDINFTPLENKLAVLNAAAVNVRRDTNLESPIMAMLLQGAKLEATGDSEHWIRVNIDDESGYIMKPYAYLEDGVLVYDKVPSDVHIAKTEDQIIAPTGHDGTAVVEFAKQFLGNPYVWGGTSLTNGADCSGFVQSIYKNFGYQLKRTSAQQRNEGIAVSSLSEAMPGDLICYDGHIGIFAGQGVGLIHASNKRSGIIITSNPSYRPIVAIRRIIY